MEKIRTYKRKLILTKAQQDRIDAWIGTSRFLYNMALEVRIAAWRNKQQPVHKYELMKQITTIRDVDWIKDPPIDVLQNTIERLDKSYKQFFSGGGFPKFAQKGKYRSIDFKMVYGISENKIKLPKIGWLKYFKDAPILGNPKTASIVKDVTGYFACIQCEEVPLKFVSENQTIGLDMGLSHFCIDSNGKFIANPKHFKKYERRLCIENKSLARKKKGSNSWKKQCRRLAMLHHKIANVRKDFLHKESTTMAKRYSNVYMEDLNIKGMSRNKNLSKHILDAGWGMFKVMLSYKTNVTLINPKHTSQTCNECGAVDPVSRVTQSEFVCTSCGHVVNADTNAAKNILGKGIALDRKREPTGCALVLEEKSMSVKINKMIQSISENNKPVLNEAFADNGAHSHWELIDSSNGEILWSETTSPGYWQKRCEAAELVLSNVDVDLGVIKNKGTFFYADYKKWQQLKSSPPQTKP